MEGEKAILELNAALNRFAFCIILLGADLGNHRRTAFSHRQSAKWLKPKVVELRWDYLTT